MTWLSVIRLYRTEDVPDHVLEQIGLLIDEIGKKIAPILEKHEENIVLSAFNRLHAAFIVQLITEEGLLEATKTEMIGLMRNVEHISGKDFKFGTLEEQP